MNSTRRAELRTVLAVIKSTIEKLELLRDNEQMSYDNLPEGIQYSERGETMQEAIDSLDEAIDSLDSAMDSIESAI